MLRAAERDRIDASILRLPPELGEVVVLREPRYPGLARAHVPRGRAPAGEGL